MSDLSLEDQNFAVGQTEWIAENDDGDDFVGDIIAQVRVALSRDSPDHFPPCHAMTAIQGIGQRANDTDQGVGVHGIGDAETDGSPTGTGVLGFGLTGVRGESQWGENNGHGVVGICNNRPSLPPYRPSAGVLGQGFGLDVPGVRGEGASAPGVEGRGRIGVQGETDLKGTGVLGVANQGIGTAGLSTTGSGVFGESGAGNGVAGFSQTNHAVFGDNLSTPVTYTLKPGTFARTSGCYGVTLNNRGVSGVVGLEDWAKNDPKTIDDFATGVFGQAGLYFGVTGLDERGKPLPLAFSQKASRASFSDR
jgi:hypothetical protein